MLGRDGGPLKYCIVLYKHWLEYELVWSVIRYFAFLSKIDPTLIKMVTNLKEISEFC